MRGLQPRIIIRLLLATIAIARGNKINLQGCKPLRTQQTFLVSPHAYKSRRGRKSCFILVT
jgi:hypothetical protein